VKAPTFTILFVSTPIRFNDGAWATGETSSTPEFEADKTAIKKVVNRGSQQKSALAIEPFLTQICFSYS